MRGFVLRNVGFMLERQADVVKPFEQAVTGKFVNGKFRCETLVITHSATLEISRDLVIRGRFGTAGELGGLFFG